MAVSCSEGEVEKQAALSNSKTTDTSIDSTSWCVVFSDQISINSYTMNAGMDGRGGRGGQSRKRTDTVQ